MEVLMANDIQKYEYYKGFTDEELLFKLQKDNETEVIDYIMEKYKNLVRKHANMLFLIGGDTDDLIQEGMIGLFKAIREYDFTQNTSFYTFADLCVKRQMYTAIEALNRKKHAPLNTYISLSGTDQKDKSNEDWLESVYAFSSMNPEQIMLDHEHLQLISKQLDEKLSALEKEVLSYHLRGVGYVQIAQLLEKPTKTIDNALQRIKNKVADIL